MHLKKLTVTVCVMVVMVFMSAVEAAPITFNTALPVAKDEYLFREQFVLNQSGKDPGNLNRDRTAITAVTTLAYGINHKLSVFGILPYQSIELELDMAGQRIKRENSGVGDLSVFGRYIFHQHNQPGETFRLAAFAGLKVPTGDENASDGIGSLPPAVLTGSGSRDIFAGLVLTHQTLDYQIDGQLSYRVNNEANNFEAGNLFRLDGSLQYRMWPRSLGSGVPAFLYGVLEVNLVNQEKNKVGGVDDNNSGGTRLFISPGVQYVTRRWIAETALQIPVSQNLHGTALENDYIFRVGMRFNF